MATNSLIDKYNLLLKRGMPEHPRLRIVKEWDSLEWLMQVNAGDLYPVDAESDAQDLIEAHAMRWFCDGEICRVDKDLVGPYYVYKWTERPGRSGGSGPTILDAIIAATAHLDGDGEVAK
jgi:hypothetical protein